MKHKMINFIVNSFFLLLICAVALTISTISLTMKYNRFQDQYVNGIKATVIKTVIPVTSLTKGVVKKVYVQVGTEVKKGDMLVEIDNPLTRDLIRALQQFQDNVSAQTEARTAQASLRYFTITSPTDGVVGNVFITEGIPVDETTKIIEIYSNANAKLLANLTMDQYVTVQHMNSVEAYSERLNQNFIVKPNILKPEQENALELSEKKIGLYLTLSNASDAANLINNEDLVLHLRPLNSFIRPVDYIIKFWNNVFGMANQ